MKVTSKPRKRKISWSQFQGLRKALLVDIKQGDWYPLLWSYVRLSECLGRKHVLISLGLRHRQPKVPALSQLCLWPLVELFLGCWSLSAQILPQNVEDTPLPAPSSSLEEASLLPGSDSLQDVLLSVSRWPSLISQRESDHVGREASSFWDMIIIRIFEGMFTNMI